MINDVRQLRPWNSLLYMSRGFCRPMRQPSSSPASMPGGVCSPKRSLPMKPSSLLSRKRRSRLSSTQSEGEVTRAGRWDEAGQGTAGIGQRRDSGTYPRRLSSAWVKSGNWVDVGIPGVQECLLDHDPLRNAETKLIRMAPGSTLPAHRHRGVEECFLLEGDIDMYGRDLRRGTT